MDLTYATLIVIGTALAPGLAIFPRWPEQSKRLTLMVLFGGTAIMAAEALVVVLLHQ